LCFAAAAERKTDLADDECHSVVILLPVIRNYRNLSVTLDLVMAVHACNRRGVVWEVVEGAARIGRGRRRRRRDDTFVASDENCGREGALLLSGRVLTTSASPSLQVMAPPVYCRRSFQFVLLL
ncbi:hypothetical protein PFISCL1PPCAC_9138, partial [Pristionchus fissidentatus]